VENVEPDQNYDGLSNVNVYNQVVVPSLETLNNKRIYSEGIVTVENLMTNSSTNQGITKESTLNFDLYVPSVTFNPITKNNVNYTLSQLTQDQSDYFSKNSIIKCNITPIKPKIQYIGVSEIDNSYYTEINLNDFTKSTGNYNYFGEDVLFVFGLDVGRFFFGYNSNTGTYNYGHHCLYYSLTHVGHATPQIVKFLDSNKKELFRTVVQSDMGINMDRGLAFLNYSFDINCGNTTYNNYWKNNTG